MTNCWFAYKGLSIDQDFNLKPCGKSELIFGTYDSPAILKNDNHRKFAYDIFDNKTPNECFNCTQRESRGLQSRRTYHYDWFTQTKQYDLEFLDLTLSNLCNLKCRMCNPSLSSQWIKESHLQNRIDVEMVGFENNKINDLIDDDFLDFIRQCLSLRRIILKGGEPLIHPRLTDFLEAIQNKSNVELQIITNGTRKLSKKLQNLLNQFKSIDIYFSIEAADKMYEYIRGGQYTFRETLSNFLQYRKCLSNAAVNWIYTANIYGVFSFDSLQKQIYDTCGYIFTSTDFGQIVLNPKFLNPLILPWHIKNSIANQTPYKNYKNFITTDINKIDIKNTESELVNFFQYTTALDKIRNDNLLSIEPKFTRLFRYIYENGHQECYPNLFGNNLEVYPVKKNSKQALGTNSLGDVYDYFFDNGSILDIGGGAGNLLEYKETKITKYTSIDISKKAINLGKQMFPNQNFIFYNKKNWMYNLKGSNVNFPTVPCHDYIFMNSVFTCTDYQDLLDTLDNVIKLFNKKIVFSVFDKNNYKTLKVFKDKMNTKTFYKHKTIDFDKWPEKNNYIFYLFENYLEIYDKHQLTDIDLDNPKQCYSFLTAYDIQWLANQLQNRYKSYKVEYETINLDDNFVYFTITKGDEYV